MTNFKKRKTRKRHNKNNRKKRTRKLKGGGVINNIKLLIKAQQVRHPLDFKRNHIWNHPDGQILKPKWLNILKTGSQILPGIGAVYDNDERFKSYGEMTLSELKKTEKKIIKEISDYDEWTKKCKPFDNKENNLTCDQLAIQRGVDCRDIPSNHQAGKKSYLFDIPTPGNQSNPQGGNIHHQTEETSIEEKFQPPEQSTTKATFDFVGEESDELSFNKDDDITVIEDPRLFKVP